VQAPPRLIALSSLLPGPFAEIVSVLVLVGVLAFAVLRPRDWPEALAAVPGAGLLIALGAVPSGPAWSELHTLLPVVGFLACVLVLAWLCAEDGLFEAAGRLVALYTGSSAQRLLVGVFAVASVVTAVLSLDATVVLLTPVVFVTASRVGAHRRPQVYACGHLSNTASLLLPVSNLTNLLALGASGLSFLRFGAVMALPWAVAIAVEYGIFRWFFRRDLAEPTAAVAGATAGDDGESDGLPVFTPAVLVLTLIGFVVCSLTGVNSAWAAFGGALVVALRALVLRRATVRGVVLAANPAFCVFVLALGVIVSAVVQNGLGTAVGDLIPRGSGFLPLLAVAAIAAVLANVINNLPAVLAMLPLVASGGVGPVLAVLLGVNLGPNLSYAGSLATLLWRRVLRDHQVDPGITQFTRLGALTVPATLLAATAALWASLAITGS
jgi:arsenical pump membrane protein